jgi:hypothetical protein
VSGERPPRPEGAAASPDPQPPREAAPPDLPPEKHAEIAALVDVHVHRPRAEVLAPFGLSEGAWEAAVAALNRRLVAEIRARSGSDAPIEERYPLSAAYAKAYALAVRDARSELARGEDEATVRIAPGTPRDEPFSVLGASNRAAARTR